jgi:hypothetical protein
MAEVARSMQAIRSRQCAHLRSLAAGLAVSWCAAMPMTLPRLAPLLASCLLPVVLGCQEPSLDPPPIGEGTDGPPTTQGTVTADGTADGTATDTGSGTATDTAEVPTTCDDIVCVGNGGCLVENGIAGCYCDEGYVLDEAGTTCVVDESCIELRFLEDRCRQTVNGPPAVTLFFAVDYCAGTAVLPEALEAQGLGFQILENGVDIANNVESYATVIPKDVESYVTLVLDVSDSITGTAEAPNPDLPLLVAELRDFVQELAPAPGEPDVYVSVLLFGRFLHDYAPFTRDYVALDEALAEIENDPIGINMLVNGDGTRLYDAAATGIHRTQRIRDLRDAVTWGGVLTTGTVVVVTDGLESTNGTLDTTLINGTLNQVITIGVSQEVTDNDADLRAIGRDGSFLAPNPEDWAPIFDTVVERVQQYPERAYLLGYCTSAAQGLADVEVSLEGGVVPVQTATCNFDASAFSVDPTVTCSPELFETECDVFTCGGLTACGACADDQCCGGSQCGAPTDATSAGLDCDDSDQLCNATDQICAQGPAAEDPFSCQDPDVLGGACDPGCEPGMEYCVGETGMGECVAVLPVDPSGEHCEAAEQCASLNCRSANPDNELLLPTCLPPALIYDDCGAPGFTVCEVGSYCDGNACAPQELLLESCSNAEDCRMGRCEAPVSSPLCLYTGACFWAWDEKVPS